MMHIMLEQVGRYKYTLSFECVADRSVLQKTGLDLCAGYVQKPDPMDHEAAELKLIIGVRYRIDTPARVLAGG